MGEDDPREQAPAEPQTPDIPTDSLAFDPPAIDSPGIDSEGNDSPVIDSPGIDPPDIDSLVIDPLGIGLPDDSTHTAVDSTFSAEDSPRPQVAPDSLSGQTVFLSLDDLYHLIEVRYPGTEYASHASARRAALDAVLYAVEEVREPGEDSLDVVVDVMAPLSQEVVDAAPEGTFGLASDVPLNANVGGFGWKVASVPSPLAAQAMLRNFSERGLRAAVVQESTDGRVLYVLLLGQFASVEEAEAVRDDLPTTGVGRDLEVVPILGLDLLDTTGLDRLRPD